MEIVDHGGMPEDQVLLCSNTMNLQLEKITEEQVTKCWKTIYHLLDLYATLPETKFIDQRTSITQLTNADISLLQRSRLKYNQMMSADQMKTPETEKSSSKPPSYQGHMLKWFTARILYKDKRCVK